MKWTHGEFRPNSGLVEVDGQNRTDFGYIYFDATEGMEMIEFRVTLKGTLATGKLEAGQT